MRRHQGAKVKHFDVSNVIYHKFSHGAVSYMLNGKNVNVMLEFVIGYTVSMLWAFCKGLKFRSSDKYLGIISFMYITHMPISK